MTEKMNEDDRGDVICLLNKDDVVDAVHLVGQRMENRTHSTIIQFTRGLFTDAFWKLTKESRVCREAGVRFVEDHMKEDRLARAAR